MRKASISARNAITGSPLASGGPATRPRPVGAIALETPACSSCSARNRVVWYSSRLGSGLACSLRRTSRSSSRRDSTDSSITLRQPIIVKAVSTFCESSTTALILPVAAALQEARGREGAEGATHFLAPRNRGWPLSPQSSGICHLPFVIRLFPFPVPHSAFSGERKESGSGHTLSGTKEPWVAPFGRPDPAGGSLSFPTRGRTPRRHGEMNRPREIAAPAAVWARYDG